MRFVSQHRYSVVNQLITTDLDVIEEEDSDFTDSDISDLQSYTGKLLQPTLQEENSEKIKFASVNSA